MRRRAGRREELRVRDVDPEGGGWHTKVEHGWWSMFLVHDATLPRQVVCLSCLAEVYGLRPSLVRRCGHIKAMSGGEAVRRFSP
eukprot:2762124-Rhodomonas_salina.4